MATTATTVHQPSVSWNAIATNKNGESSRFAHLWNDDNVQRLVSHTLYQWVFCPDGAGGGCLMFHRPSDVPHILHQIVIGGDYCDGVYELSIRKRHRVRTHVKGRQLTVNCTGTLDIVEIPSEDGKGLTGLCSVDLGRDGYEKALVELGYLTQTQLEEGKRLLATKNVRMLHQVYFDPTDKIAA